MMKLYEICVEVGGVFDQKHSIRTSINLFMVTSMDSHNVK